MSGGDYVELRRLAIELRDMGLRGRWAWSGDGRYHSLCLATVGRGKNFVMNFARWARS